MGHDLVLLVGDVDYYKRFGFVPATPHGFVMPGEKRPERLQVAPLKRGLLGVVRGDIRHAHGRAIVPAAIDPALAGIGAAPVENSQLDAR